MSMMNELDIDETSLPHTYFSKCWQKKKKHCLYLFYLDLQSDLLIRKKTLRAHQSAFDESRRMIK